MPHVNLFYCALPCFTRFKLFFAALPCLCPTYPFILFHARFSILSTFSSSCPPFRFRPPYPFMPRYAKLPRVYKLMLNLPLFLILMPHLFAFLSSAFVKTRFLSFTFVETAFSHSRFASTFVFALCVSSICLCCNCLYQNPVSFIYVFEYLLFLIRCHENLPCRIYLYI